MITIKIIALVYHHFSEDSKAYFIRNQRNHPLAGSLESTDLPAMLRIALQAGTHGVYQAGGMGHADGRECREAPEDPIRGISLRKPFQWMPIP